MKKNKVITIVLIMLISSLFVGCFEAENEAKISFTVYSLEMNNTFDGKCKISVCEVLVGGIQPTKYDKTHRDSRTRNFTLDEGQYAVIIEDDNVIHKRDFYFNVGSKTRTVEFFIIMPASNDADDVNKNDVIMYVNGKEKKID
ncbi:hypothetical protein KAH94_03760 [bacterium]|nr:hypothetical protein [bacterium]